MILDLGHQSLTGSDVPPNAPDVRFDNAQGGLHLGLLWAFFYARRLKLILARLQKKFSRIFSILSWHPEQDGWTALVIFKGMKGENRGRLTGDMKKEENLMDWGVQNRLNRLIQSDGHCFFLPIDRDYFQGPTSKVEKPGCEKKSSGRVI